MKISMVRKTVFLMVAVTLLWCGISQASLTYTPIPFAYNSYNWGRDVNYPTGNPVVLGGIPFNIPSYPNNNTWDSNQGIGTFSLTIPVNIANVQQVYTLINTSWGIYGAQLTTLDFNFSGGLTDHIVLTDGVDIRDWWNGAYTNTISPPTVQVYSGTGTPPPYLPTRVDMQTFTFGSAYAGHTLDDIVITDNGWTGGHRAFLYGVTAGANPVPVPSALILLGSGLAGLGGWRKFRRH